MFDLGIRRLTFSVVYELDGIGFRWPVGRWVVLFWCRCRWVIRVGGPPPFEAVRGGIIREDFGLLLPCKTHVSAWAAWRMRELMPDDPQLRMLVLRPAKPEDPPPDGDELWRSCEFERWRLEYESAELEHEELVASREEDREVEARRRPLGVLRTMETIGALIHGPKKKGKQ